MKAAHPDWNIEILGVNEIGQENYSGLIADESSLPWLQDTSAAQVWNLWQVRYRDLRILDAQNQLFAVYNLTDHDLAYPTNQAALKNFFLQAAQAQDTNHDGLPDAWETQYFGTAGIPPGEEANGVDAFSEFAFGLNPLQVGRQRPIQVSYDRKANQVAISFRRPAGWILDYVIETSPDLRRWSAADPSVLANGDWLNLYDGSGDALAAYNLPGGANGASEFIRVRAIPRSPMSRTRWR